MDPSSGDDIVIENMHDISDLLGRAANLQRTVDTANATAKAMKEAAEAQRRDLVEPLNQRIDQIMNAVGAYAKPRRRWWLRRYGRTVSIPGGGTVAWRVVPRSLETPKNTEGIVNQLLLIRGGKRYLSVKYSLDKRALASASPALLRRLGLWAGPHEWLVVATDGQNLKDGFVYSVRRFPWRTKRSPRPNKS